MDGRLDYCILDHLNAGAVGRYRQFWCDYQLVHCLKQLQSVYDVVSSPVSDDISYIWEADEPKENSMRRIDADTQVMIKSDRIGPERTVAMWQEINLKLFHN